MKALSAGPSQSRGARRRPQLLAPGGRRPVELPEDPLPRLETGAAQAEPVAAPAGHAHRASAKPALAVVSAPPRAAGQADFNGGFQRRMPGASAARAFGFDPTGVFQVWPFDPSTRSGSPRAQPRGGDAQGHPEQSRGMAGGCGSSQRSTSGL